MPTKCWTTAPKHSLSVNNWRSNLVTTVISLSITQLLFQLDHLATLAISRSTPKLKFSLRARVTRVTATVGPPPPPTAAHRLCRAPAPLQTTQPTALCTQPLATRQPVYSHTFDRTTTVTVTVPITVPVQQQQHQHHHHHHQQQQQGSFTYQHPSLGSSQLLAPNDHSQSHQAHHHSGLQCGAGFDVEFVVEQRHVGRSPPPSSPPPADPNLTEWYHRNCMSQSSTMSAVAGNEISPLPTPPNRWPPSPPPPTLE